MYHKLNLFRIPSLIFNRGFAHELFRETLKLYGRECLLNISNIIQWFHRKKKLCSDVLCFQRETKKKKKEFL